MTAACLLRGLLEPFFGDVLLQVPRCVSGLPQLSLHHYMLPPLPCLYHDE